MSDIYDEDKPVDHGNAADEEYRHLTGGAGGTKPKADGGEESGSDSGSRSSSSSSAGGTKLGKGGKTDDGGLFSGSEGDSRLKKLSSRFGSMSKRKKMAMAFGGGAAGVGLIGGLFGLFAFSNIFRLDHLMSNIEAKSFVRYQVDMDGRSSKWIGAYLALRMGEIDEPELAPQDRQNLLFRADRVDNNNPATDWYRTMRATRFEQDLLEKQKIKFTSVAYMDGNQMKFRPGIITIDEQRITFELTAAERAALDSGNPNLLNGRLRDFINVEVLENDRAGRHAIRDAVNSNTKWYQVMKRLYVRKSIQNMTGVRSWRFFENTRNKLDEKKISIRNKIISSALPESTKSGKYIQCLFGIVECRGSTDTNNPENRADSSTIPGASCSTQPELPACNTGLNDDGTPTEGDTVVNNGAAEAGLTEGAGDEAIAKGISGDLIKKIVSKLNLATGIVSLIDTLNTINKNIKSGSVSKAVYMARATQAIGIATVFGIARDQTRSGELTAEEQNQFMEAVDGAATSEGWNTVIENNAVEKGKASAAAMLEAKSKEEYCSTEHQEAMLLPENAKAAAKEYHYLCDSEKIGSADLAKTIENGWNESIGTVLAPVFAAYNGTGLSSVVGAINGAIDAVLGPIISGTLKGLGLSDNVEELGAWAVAKAASILGAGPAIQEGTPAGSMVNHVLMGESAQAETAMRFQGAARTNSTTASRATQAVALYKTEEKNASSITTRYLSLSNPQSLFSTVLFNASNSSSKEAFGSMVSSIMSLPAAIISPPVKAADNTNDAYAASKFAGVNTYDFPKECLDSDPVSMTPESSTNADELGLITSAELTWDLMENSDSFYQRLYEMHPDDGDTIDKVYDCAALDSTVSGALGALYDDSLVGPNALVDGGGDTTASDQGLQFRIASFNILHSDDSKASWNARLRLSTDLLLGRNNKANKKDSIPIDVAGLQEVREDQLAAFKTSEYGGDTYDVYPSSPEHGNDLESFSPNVVIWNKAKFKAVTKSSIPFTYFDNAKMEAPLIKLQDITTGQEFYVTSIHDPADTHGDARGLRLANVQEYAKLLNKMQQEGTPIFFTGDYNSAYEIRHGGNETVGDNKDNLAYCVMTETTGASATGLWDAWDAYKNRPGKCPSVSKDNPSAIDHIFLSRDVSVTNYIKTEDGKSKDGSDHPAVIADVAIGGAGKAEDFTVGTYNIKHEIAWGGSCKLNECAEKRSQRQANILLGKADNPAFDIVGSQEVSVPQHNRFKTMLTNYGYFPEDVPEHLGTSIYWNKAKFEMFDSGYIDTISNISSPYKRPWVGLKSLQGNNIIYVMSAHAPNNGYGNAQGRATVAQDAYDWAASKVGSADTVIVMGDWNEQPTVGNGYCILTQNTVLQNALDMAEKRNPSKPCPNKKPSTIDQIYLTPKAGITASGWKHPANEGIYRTASDHRPTYVTIHMPGTEDPAASSGNGSSFKIATFNIYFNTDERRYDYSIGQWKERLERSANVIKSEKVDVAGLQEVRESQWARLQDNALLGASYGIYPKNYAAGGYASQHPIVYNTSKFDLVESGSKPISGTQITKAGIFPSSNIQVRLRDKATGQEFYVINTHEPVGNGFAIQARLTGAKNRAEYVKNLAAKEGIPIFLTGDFNAKYNDNNPNQQTAGGQRSNLGYCVLTDNTGLWDAWDASNNNKKHCPSKGTDQGDSVDHIYLSSNVQVTNYDRSHAPRANGSDVHKTVIASVTIPATQTVEQGDGNYGSEGWVWPLSKNDWNGPFGYNVWGSCGVKCRHAGIDMSGSGGSPVLAAHSGTVVSAGYVILTRGACKYQLLVKATGTPYYYAYQHMGSITVGRGDTVTAGERVGTVDRVGPTGDCGSGAHLHFSVERSAKVSAYANGAGVCDVNQVSCAKKMSSLPPLCFLDKDGRNYGSSVPASQTKGSSYCEQVIGGK